MEQEAEGRGSKQQPQPPPQPQQCPRCESLNTKFCYYNNYSLSQPRFFCKACKRYWTQGGTLRNIPIGGSSRKGKRSKGSSSSSTMSSSGSQPQSEPQPQLQPRPRPQPATQDVVPNVTTLMKPTPPRVVHSTSPYYQGDGVGGSGDSGYLSSLAAVNSLNPPPQPWNQSLNIEVGDVVASPNTDLLSGFNTPASASLGSQHHHPSQIRPSQFYQIGNSRVVGSLISPEQGFNVPPSMANSSAVVHPYHGPQSFTNNANHRTANASLWSTVSTTTSISANTQNSTRGGSSSSLIPNNWPNLPGNGSPSQ